MPTKINKATQKEKRFSQSEDALIRQYIKAVIGIQLSENYFWKLTPSAAIERLHTDYPETKDVESGELEIAARREE